MGALTRRLLEALRTGGEVLRNEIRYAPFLCSRAASPPMPTGIPDVDAETVSPEELVELRDTLTAALRHHPDTSVRSAIVFVLGDVLDILHEAPSPEILDALRAELHSALNRMMEANALLANALVLLRRFDRPGFDPAGAGGSFSARETDRNVALAAEYLASRGVRVPW